MKNGAWILILLAGICWGCIGLFTKRITVLGFSEMEMLFIKMVVDVLLLAVILYSKDKKLLRIYGITDIKYFIGTGICSFVFFSWCYMKAINETSLGVAAVLLYTAPAIVMVLSVFLFHEKLTYKKCIVVAMTFAGCVLVTGMADAQALHYSAKGIWFGLCSGVGYALYSIFGTFALKKGYPSFTVTFYTFLMAMLFLLFMVKPLALFQKITAQGVWIEMLLFSVFTALVPYICYTKGLSAMEASKASVLATTEPVVASVIGILVFSEGISWQKLIGILLVLGGILLRMTEERKTQQS